MVVVVTITISSLCSSVLQICVRIQVKHTYKRNNDARSCNR
jgi:hypothetical protein